MKQGTEFEQLTAHIFGILSQGNTSETVEHNVMLDGPDGPRQIDVLIRGKVGPFDVLTIVECKDHGNKVNVTQLDALYSKMQDVKANKAVLVSRKGFTDGAKKKAKRLDISLCTAHSAQYEKWKFEPRMPLLIREVCCENFEINLPFKTPSQSDHPDHLQNVSIPLVMDGRAISDLIVDYWNATEFACEDGRSVHTFKPDIANPYVFFNDDPDDRCPVTDFSIDLKLRTSYFLGSFNDIESTQFLQAIDDNKTHVIFNTADLGNYREHFVQFSKLTDVPPAANRTSFTAKYLKELTPIISTKEMLNRYKLESSRLP